MIVRIFIGVGLFTLGYLVGKEMGRAESIRDQLRWATEGDDPMPTRRDSGEDARTEASDQTVRARSTA